MKPNKKGLNGIGVLFFPPECNNKCIICDYTGPVKGLQKDFEGYKREINNLAEKHGVVQLYGGEPFLNPDIFRILEHIARFDVECMIWSNTRVFSRKSLAEKISKFRISRIQTTLFSYNEMVHDYHTGVSGSYSEAVEGIKNLLDVGVPVGATIVVTKKNLNDLEKTVEFLINLGVKKIKISGLVNFGRMLNRPDLIPDFDGVKREIKKVLRIARQPGVLLAFEKLPRCAAMENSNFIYEQCHKSIMLICPPQKENCLNCPLTGECMCSNGGLDKIS